MLASGFGADWSRAQSYPTKTVRILTSSVGTGSDIMARIVAAELSTPLGQPVVVESRPTGPVLAVAAARAAPDGYSLLVAGSTLWIAPLFADVSYDYSIRDFAPIVTLARLPSLLVVHPSLPVRSVAELIKLAKAKPGQLNIATGPDGGSQHIAAELLKSLANLDIVRILYTNQSLATADSLSGQVQLTFGTAGTWAAHIKAGKVRSLASTGSMRSVLYPDLPTVAETLPGYVVDGLNGFFAPAKTAEAIVRRLNQEAVRVIEKPEVRERLLNIGQEPVGGSPEQFTDTIKSEITRVSKLIKDIGIKAGGK